MKKLILALAILATSVCAYAGPMNVVFIGFHTGGWPAGYPYYATVNGSAVTVMCDDWVHGGQPGDYWQAYFTNLGTSDLSRLRFNTMSNPLTLYREAGWLLLQTATSPGSAEATDINWAVWHIFDPSVSLGPGQRNWLHLAQQEASNGFPGVNFYRVGIYTPVDQYDPNHNHPQELLEILPPSTTPEPGTLVLLGTAIAGLVTRKLRS